jgi:hypothetical protein
MLARVGVVTLVMASLVSERGMASPHDTGHRISAGYFASRPIAGDASRIAQGFALRWAHLFGNRLELGAGVELGYSGGEEALSRVALLPTIAWVGKLSAVAARIDASVGPQLVSGRVTIDGIPLKGIETRSIHAELGGAIDAELAPTLDIRGRAGLGFDGLYPAGHASTRVAPFVELAVVLHL